MAVEIYERITDQSPVSQQINESTNFYIFWKYSFKISVWFLERIQYTAFFAFNVGKMKEGCCQPSRIWCPTHRFGFDCLNQNSLTAKLHSYGISLSSLRLLVDFLKNKKQNTKVKSCSSPWVDIENVVIQGSILGPLPFNISCAICF